jgi:hypothetical protein
MACFVVDDDRSQSTMFPELLDNDLAADNPVMAIDGNFGCFPLRPKLLPPSRGRVQSYFPGRSSIERAIGSFAPVRSVCCSMRPSDQQFAF